MILVKILGYGSLRLERYNGLPAVQIQGSATPGQSSGDATLMMEQLASKLPSGIGYEWTACHTKNVYQIQAPALYTIF